MYLYEAGQVSRIKLVWCEEFWNICCMIAVLGVVIHNKTVSFVLFTFCKQKNCYNPKLTYTVVANKKVVLIG